MVHLNFDREGKRIKLAKAGNVARACVQVLFIMRHNNVTTRYLPLMCMFPSCGNTLCPLPLRGASCRHRTIEKKLVDKRGAQMCPTRVPRVPNIATNLPMRVVLSNLRVARSWRQESQAVHRPHHPFPNCTSLWCQPVDAAQGYNRPRHTTHKAE